MSSPPKPRKGRKISKVDVDRRMAFAEDALTALTPMAEFTREFCGRFKVGKRCAQDYAKRVRDQWAEEGKTAVDRDAKRAEIERAVDLSFREARAAGDPKVMVAAMNLKAQLHGLLRTRTEVSGPNGGPIPIADAHAALAAALASVAPESEPGAAGGAAGQPAG